ncbi:hypothetical protein [Methylotuvimicrobium buryatense]|uniref:hypothetical protein n=1 Tax=Methylotuvimicrobium buryatense TaxID=95641 RepID=UPI000348AE4D|nr:hypothetical protein [Methylotuvimicrobium buryatense]
MQRLGIDHETFIAHGTQLLKEFGCAVGKSESLIALAAERQARYLRGMHTANALFGKAA